MPRKVDVRLPGKGNSNSHGARPVHLIISMVKWIQTSRLSIKNSLSLTVAGCCRSIASKLKDLFKRQGEATELLRQQQPPFCSSLPPAPMPTPFAPLIPATAPTVPLEAQANTPSHQSIGFQSWARPVPPPYQPVPLPYQAHQAPKPPALPRATQSTVPTP